MTKHLLCSYNVQEHTECWSYFISQGPVRKRHTGLDLNKERQFNIGDWRSKWQKSWEAKWEKVRQPRESCCESSGWRNWHYWDLRGCSGRGGHLAEARVTKGTVQWVLGPEETQSLLEISKETGREEEIPCFSPTPALKFSPTALHGPNLVGSRIRGPGKWDSLSSRDHNKSGN